MGASVGILIGAGYGGYTHYLINAKKTLQPVENEEFAFLKERPEVTPHFKVRFTRSVLSIMSMRALQTNGVNVAEPCINQFVQSYFLLVLNLQNLLIF